MVALRFVETLRSGIDAYDQALADLEVVSGPDGDVLAAVAGSGGGIVTYTIGAAGAAFAGVTNITATAQAGQRPQITDLGDGEMIVTGANGDSVSRLLLDEAGTIATVTAQGGLSGAVQSSRAVLLDSDTLVVAGPARASATAYGLDIDNALHNGVTLDDTETTHADTIGALGAGTGAASDVLLVASQSEYGVTAYTMQGGGFIPGDSIGPADGLGIMVPTDIAMVGLDGRSFAIIASSAGASGAAGALSVLAVGANGALTPTDHLLDTRDSRFGGVQSVAAVEVDGRGFVVAGGGDHGLSLLTLTPGGQLIHLQSIADTPAIGLGGAIDIELAVNGDRIEVFVITQPDAGIAHFSVDLGDLGDTATARDTGEALQGDNRENLMIGGAGADTLVGSGKDDILLDGAGEDRLSGDGGADLFVLVQDGMRDTITDFNPATDRIDLSGWAFLHDKTQLLIEVRGGQTRITHREERLDVIGNDGAPVDPEILRDAIRLDVNRSFLPPSVETYGSATDEALTGTWGTDTITGRAGDDTIDGLQGDDYLNGGGGENTLVLDTRSRDVTVVDLGDGTFEIHSSQGVDYARAFAFYAFRDATLSTQQMQALAVADPGVTGVVDRGTAANDDLHGNTFNDTLLGEAGDDVLGGRSGNDSLDGGRGNDTLKGNAGNDSLFGGLDDDRLSGGTGDDVLDGGHGRNRLSGQRGDDRLEGGDQRDILNGGSGQDSVNGNGGNDRMVGGRNDDRMSGGAGPDKLYGNADGDRLEGGADADLLNGGGGDDTLIGGLGDDYLKGGSGRDVFHYARGDARDRIVDFDPAQDIFLFSEDILAAYRSAQELVDDVASITGPGVIFDFGGGDQLLLNDLFDVDRLVDAVYFE